MVERSPRADGMTSSSTICWHKPELLKPLPSEADEFERDLKRLALESEEYYAGERLDNLVLNQIYDRQIARIKA